MEKIDILKEIQNVFRSIFDDESLMISEDTLHSEMEKWDSFEHFQIIAAFERTFDIRLSIEDILSCECVGDIVSFIKEHMLKNPVDKLTLEHASFEEKNPVSSVQERLYTLYCMNPERLDYNVTSSVLMEGNLNIERLKIALDNCLKCNPMLTARFHQINGILYYKIRPKLQIEIEIIQYESKGYDSFEKFKKNELKAFIKPFQLFTDELLMRAKLIKYEEEKYLLLLDFHHIMFDGVSVPIFMNDLQEFYNHPNRNDEKKYNYCDFVNWQGKYVESDEYVQKQVYWKDVLSSETSLCDLLIDNPVKRGEILSSDSYKIELFNYKEIDEFCRCYGITKYTFFTAILALVLSKLTFQTDITFGTFVSGRYHFKKQLNSIIGMFVNTLPVRNNIPEDISFIDFITSVQKNNNLLLKNSDVLYETISDISRNMKKNSPLFDVCFRYQDSYNKILKLDNVNCFVDEEMTSDCVYDLMLMINVREESFEIVVNYANALYKKSTIENMLNLFVNVIDNVLGNIHITLKDIPISSFEDENKILEEFNATYVNYPQNKSVVQIFEEQVKKTPENIAVVFEEAAIW